MRKTFLLTLLVIIILASAQGNVLAAVEGGVVRASDIDKSHYPDIKMNLSIFSRGKVGRIKVREDGRPAKGVTAKSVIDEQSVAVDLVIDVSGSMTGRALEDAKTAAALFVDRAAPEDRIGITAFSSTSARVHGFSNDKESLKRAISGLAASGETAVYDAVSDSVKNLSEQRSERKVIILLTDGADTASSSTADVVRESVKVQASRVYVVALRSPEFDLGPWAGISKESGGALLEAPSSQDLQRLYDGIAADLDRRYLITYLAQSSGMSKVEITAEVDNRVERAVVEVDLPSSAAKKAVSVPDPAPDAKSAPMPTAIPWVAAALGFAATFILVIGLAGFMGPSDNVLAEQLKYYDQLKDEKAQEVATPAAGRAFNALVGFAGDVSTRRDFTGYAQSKLERAGLPIKPHEYMVVHIIAVAAVSLAAYILSGSFVLAVLFVALGVIVPLLVVQVLIGRRKAAFEEQLPDTLELLASSMRAGYSLQQAVATSAGEARPPMAGELSRASGQTNLGVPLQEALGGIVERMDSKQFSWVVLAMSIHRETGGNLAEILDNLAASLRDRQTVYRQIRALTAEGRLSAVILIVLPILEGLVLVYMNPQYMALLVTTLSGVQMLAMALILMVVGSLWLKSITNIEY